MVRLQKKQQNAYWRKHYQLHRGKALKQSTEYYAHSTPIKKAAMKEKYASNPKPKRAATKARYASNPEPIIAATKDRCTSNLGPERAEARGSYTSNPEPKKTAVRDRYSSNPELKKTATRKRYTKYRSVILRRLSTRYYSSRVHKRAAILLQHARHRFRDNTKNKAYRQTNEKYFASEERSVCTDGT